MAYLTRKTWTSSFCSFLFFLCIGINLVSFLHAYHLTHVVKETSKTRAPEEMTAREKLRVLLTGVKVSRQPNRKTPETYGYAYTSMLLHGPGGLETPVWAIPANAPQRTIILFHGFSSRKEALLPLADLLIRSHSDILLADFPGHGDSPYSWSTLGYREADVVKTLVDYCQHRCQAPLILQGISLGASSIILAVSRYQIKADGIILEMPYDSLYKTIKRRFSLMGFPITFPFAELLTFWGSVQHGYNAFALNPENAVHDITMPTLLLGGSHDQRVPPTSLQEMYRRVSGRKQLHFFQHAAHQSLFHAARDDYEQIILSFLESVD